MSASVRFSCSYKHTPSKNTVRKQEQHYDYTSRHLRFLSITNNTRWRLSHESTERLRQQQLWWQQAAQSMTMAFLSRLPTVLEVWAPNPSHFLMEGAFRLVSFLIGSYHPRYCGKLPTPRQPQC